MTSLSHTSRRLWSVFRLKITFSPTHGSLLSRPPSASLVGNSSTSSTSLVSSSEQRSHTLCPSLSQRLLFFSTKLSSSDSDTGSTSKALSHLNNMASTVGDLQRRLGLRGAILRGGEPWRTVEIRHFMHDVKAFYQGYEQYLCRKEPYPDTFDTDIDTMLDAHGPVLWPGGPRDQTRQPWLFLANDHPAYQHDLYYSLHRDNKIRPLFSSLLHKQVAVYHGNQKTMKQKEVKVEVEEGEVAATTTSSPAWPRSPLTNADTAADEPWSPDRNVRRVQSLAGAAEPRKMTVDQEFSLRKRKRGDDSPIIRASKSSGTSVAAPSPTRDDKVITTKNQNKMMKRQSTDDVVSLSQVSTAALHHRVSLCLSDCSIDSGLSPWSLAPTWGDSNRNSGHRTTFDGLSKICRSLLCSHKLCASNSRISDTFR